MLNYQHFYTQLDHHVTELYQGINIRYIDIFEHGFLRLLGYPSVPEKASFSCKRNPEAQPDEDNLYIRLRTPYGVPIDRFREALQICTPGDFSAVIVENIDPNENNGYCLLLTVPYRLLEKHFDELYGHIQAILDNPVKNKFYAYCSEYSQENNVGLTIIHIESLVNNCFQRYPYSTSDDVWNAVVQKSINRNTENKLKIINTKIAVDVENYPKITFTYQADQGQEELSLTRDEIVSILTDPDALQKFLAVDLSTQEFLVPTGIDHFLQQYYGRNTFYSNDAGEYEIDLGYFYKRQSLLEKFGITELRSYRPENYSERGLLFVYDQQNYIKACIALKELAGSPCFKERLHQLNYYILFTDKF